MDLDLTGVLVITIIGSALIALAILFRIDRPPHYGGRTRRTPHPDITLGFRDPYR